MTKLSLTLSATLLAASALFAAPAAAEEMTYTITLTDGVVAPAELTVPAGEAFTITVTNTGETPAEFESHSLHIEEILAPGATATFDIKGLAEGSYKFVEEFHEDQSTARGVILAE
jgi:plastocyanin